MIPNFELWNSVNLAQKNRERFLTSEQIKWCDKYIEGGWSVNRMGEIEVGDNVSFLNKDSLKSFEVQFANIRETFDCSYCPLLESLKGAPKKCRIFICNNCDSLKDLKYSPAIVEKVFCSRCDSLESLEGISKDVKYLYCVDDKSLKTLKHVSIKNLEEFAYKKSDLLNSEEIDFCRDEKQRLHYVNSNLSWEEYNKKYWAKLKTGKYGL
jgi:hypothetical protein